MRLSDTDQKKSIPVAGTAAATDVKTALCDAAEEYFAEFGLEGASSRAIAERAGVHHKMIRYHFGSKQGLYETVEFNIIRRMTKYRLRRLDEMEHSAKGEKIPVRDLVSLYVADFFFDKENPKSDGSLFLKFHGWFLTQPNGETQRIHLESGFEFRQRFLKAFQRTLPDLSERDLVYRLGSLIGVMIIWRSDPGFLSSHCAAADPTPEEVVSAVIENGCRIFSA